MRQTAAEDEDEEEEDRMEEGVEDVVKLYMYFPLYTWFLNVSMVQA